MVTDKVTRYVQELQAGPSGRLASALAKATPGERDAIRRGLRLLSSMLRSRVG